MIIEPSKAARTKSPGGSSLEVRQAIYIYPNNLKPRATLRIRQLRDTGTIGMCALVPILALTQVNFFPPVVVTAVYAFLMTRSEDTSIMDFIRYTYSFFFTRQQPFEWRYRA